MKVKTLFISSLLFVFITACSSGEPDNSKFVIPVDEIKVVMESTVQIVMFAKSSSPGTPEPGGQGLGTVVEYLGERLIITHDHWSYLDSSLHEVEIRNATGQLLLTLDGDNFKRLILYRDGGSMILDSPESLVGVVPTGIANSAVEGDIIWLVRRSADYGRQQVEVISTVVTVIELDDNPPRLWLQSLDGSVIEPGDSGGGVWIGDKLLANIWAVPVILQYDHGSVTSEPTRLEVTNEVVVAIHPLGRKLGINPAEQDTGGGDTPETENGPKQVSLPLKEENLRGILFGE